MNKRYGLPYMGSKNSIATWVLSHLPKAENFYDLFCGGCSITHCAIENRMYRNYFINDIEGYLPYGFIDCLNGKYAEDYRWISHDQFDAQKGCGDLLVDICFSFGNNWRKGYAYSRDVEPLKQAIHYAVCFGDTSLLQDRFDVKLPELKNFQDKVKRMNVVKKELKGLFALYPQHLSSLDRLQNLERLIGIGELQKLSRHTTVGNITTSALSYDLVPINGNSVIYCDIPYRSTAQYNDGDFDYERFYEWCSKQDQPLYISEYEMPEDRFVCIAAKKKQVLLCAQDNAKSRIEKIFIPIHQIKNKPLTLF